jgi:uncharacterized protein (DUF952 family)
MNNKFIYHVISQREWESIAGTQFYSPQSLLDEGFIHFSFKEQIPGVIERYYKDQKGLFVLKVEVNKIKSRLEFEMVPNIGLFPHLFGKLNIDSIVGVFPLSIDENSKAFWTE